MAAPLPNEPWPLNSCRASRCDWQPLNSRAPLFIGCWQGIINGEKVQVWAGRAGIEWGIDPNGKAGMGLGIVDHNPHGLLWLSRRDLQHQVVSTEVYGVPAGTVRIAAVQGGRIRLVPDDPQVPPVSFVFDLAGRHWAPGGLRLDPPWSGDMHDCSYAPGLVSCWITPVLTGTPVPFPFPRPQE